MTDQGPTTPPPPYMSGNQLSASDEKLWATLVHLSPFVGAMVGLPFLGPLVIYLVLRERGPFIRHHSAQALNFQIVAFIAYAISFLLIFVLVGIPLLIAVAIAAFVLQIIAAVKASAGEWYHYPFTPDWVR